MPHSNFLKWVCFILFISAYIVLAGINTALAEFLLYISVASSIFIFLFHQNEYRCLSFFIVWLPFQTFLLASMTMSDLFSVQLIKFLSSLKELALIMLFVVMIKKKLIFRGKFSAVDYLYWLNVILIFVYAVIPNSFFGVSGDINVRMFGIRTALITLVIFLVGRYVPYNAVKVRSVLRLLAVVSILVVLFGFIEIIFIPRDMLIAGLIPYNVLKGESLENLQMIDLSYIARYGDLLIKRMMSFFLSPLGLAYFLIFPSAVVLSIMQQKKSHDKKILPFPIVLFGVFLLVIMLSNTRAVILAIFLMVIISIPKEHFVKTSIGSVLIILLVSVTPIKSIYSTTASLSDTSSKAHAFAYILGFDSVIKYPLGIGLGQAGPTAFFIKGSEGIYGKEEASVGESLYLTIALERGLPGLGIFVLFVCQIARVGMKLSVATSEMMEALIGKAVFLATVCFLIASIPTEHWLGFQSSGIYWWFAGLLVQIKSKSKK